MRTDPNASTLFVAVGDPGIDRSGASHAPAKPIDAPVWHDQALRAAVASAPLALGSFAFALAAELWLLPTSAWREASTIVGFAILAAASVAAWAGSRAGGSSRWRIGWLRTYAGLGIATMALFAAAPWLPGAGVSPDERLLLAVVNASPLTGSAVAFASLRCALVLAAAVPVSNALSAWHVGGRGTTPWYSNVAIGLVLGATILAIGLAARRTWRHAVVATLACDERMRALVVARDAALRADREKSRFVATASHDLRQPVHALGLFAMTLEKRLRGSCEEPLVRNIARSIDGLERSFNAMLDISRLDAGTIEPNLQHFPLRDLFRRLDMYFSGLAEQARLGLRMSPGGKWVTSDPQLLERILANLIQNALKYTERGGIVVVARTTATHFNIEVWDTGVGMRGSDLPHIFEEFYQVGRREHARVQGLGMGLAIVKRLAVLLGHTVTVKSQPGKGTMFRIGILIGGLPEIDDATAAADTLPMAAQEPRTILVLDDDEAIRDGLALLLEEWGYEPIAASNFQQAERLARTLDMPPDLILSDLHLGDGPDGIEAIEAVRRECGREIPAILITGYTAPEELARAAEGGLSVLHKPLQPRKLLGALRELVG